MLREDRRRERHPVVRGPGRRSTTRWSADAVTATAQPKWWAIPMRMA